MEAARAARSRGHQCMSPFFRCHRSPPLSLTLATAHHPQHHPRTKLQVADREPARSNDVLDRAHKTISHRHKWICAPPAHQHSRPRGPPMCENCSPLTSGRLIAHFSSEAGPLKRLHIRGTYAHAPCRSAALETATESTIRHPLARSQRPRTIFRGKVARDFTPAITIPSEALPCVLSSCFP